MLSRQTFGREAADEAELRPCEHEQKQHSQMHAELRCTYVCAGNAATPTWGR